MATNKPKLLGRKDLVDEWKKNVRRIKNAIRNMQKKGYDIPDIETFIKTPKRVTEASIRRIKKVKPSTIREKSTFKTETGETIPAQRAFVRSRWKKTYTPPKADAHRNDVYYKGKWYTLEEFQREQEKYQQWEKDVQNELDSYDDSYYDDEYEKYLQDKYEREYHDQDYYDELEAQEEFEKQFNEDWKNKELKSQLEKARQQTSDQDYREAKTALDYFQKVADLIADEFPSIKAVNYNGERLSYRDMSNEKNTLLDIWNETYGSFENDEDFTKALLSGNYLEKISEAISNVSAKNVYRWSEISQGFTALANLLKLGEPLNYSDISAVSDTITGVYDWEAEYE